MAFGAGRLYLDSPSVNLYSKPVMYIKLPEVFMLKDTDISAKDIKLDDAARRFKELVKEVQIQRAPKWITEDGQPAVVLINAEVYQNILDYLEEIEEAHDVRLVEEYEAKKARGEIEMLDWEKVKAEWEADGDLSD